jgi:hypothetical protein
MPLRIVGNRIQSGTTPSLGYEDRYPKVDMPASVLEAQKANQNIAGGNILDDLTYNQKVLGIGGATVGGLGATAAYQSMQDIKAINQMAKMGNYGPHNPMPQSFMDKLKGAYTPSSVFKQTGYPTGLKNWFFSRSSPEHFGPVEQTMKFAKNFPGYAMKGLGYLASLPASAALMTLHPTPANADEIEWQNKMMQNQRIQLMNRRKQQMQKTIRQAEAKKAAEEKAAADRKAQQQATIAANREAAKKFGDKPQKIYHQETRSQDRGGRDIGSRVSDSYEKQQSAQYGMLAKGGLVNFFKNGGFLG